MEMKDYLIRVAAVINNIPEEKAAIMVEYELDRLFEQYRVINVAPDNDVVRAHMLFILYNKVTASIQDGQVTVYTTKDGIAIDFTPRYWAVLAAKNGYMIIPPVRNENGGMVVSARRGDILITKEYSYDWIKRVLELIQEDGVKIDNEFAEGIVIKNFIRSHALDRSEFAASPSVIALNKQEDSVVGRVSSSEVRDVNAIKEDILMKEEEIDGGDENGEGVKEEQVKEEKKGKRTNKEKKQDIAINLDDLTF